MRKVALLAAALGVLAFGVTGTAYAVDASQGLAISLQSSKAGTKKKPKSVGKFKVTTTTTPAPGTTPNYATLTQFITIINKTHKHVPYIGLTGCTGGKLNFAGDFKFTDGSVLHATATAKCKK